MRAADARQLASIAFPAFGTGVGGFPIDACATIMIGAIRIQAPQLASVRRVRLVLFGKKAYEAFATVAGDLLGPPLEGPPDCPVSG